MSLGVHGLKPKAIVQFVVIRAIEVHMSLSFYAVKLVMHSVLKIKQLKFRRVALPHNPLELQARQAD
jgi:hypothetical protein